MEWAADAYNSGYNFVPKCKTFKQKIKKMEKWLNMTSCSPYQKDIILPPDNLPLKVTCFPFLPMLKSLFDDPKLN